MTESNRTTRGGRPVPPDPAGIAAPHDVLAAEEFGIGTRYERWPADPNGTQEPHDVLAAEEFALPVPDAREGRAPAALVSGRGASWGLAIALAALAAVALLRKR